MRPWSDVVGAFRDRMAIDMPKSEFIIWAILVSLIIAGLWWLMIYTQQRKKYRQTISFLDKYDLSFRQRKLLDLFIRESCNNRPESIHRALSRFNLWVGSKLENSNKAADIAHFDDTFIQDVKQLRNTVFRGNRVSRPFSSSRDLDINTNLSLYISGYSATFQAVIMAMDDLAIHLRLISKQEQPHPTPGTPVFISLPQPEALYNFETDFIALDAAAGYFSISHSREWRTVQMRAHYRHPVHLPVKFVYYQRLPNGEAINGQGSGKVVELSGGGFALISHFQGAEGGHFIFDINLTGKRLDQITGVIKRYHQDRSKSEYVIYNCEFLDLDPQFCDDIVQFIFSKQLEF
jgi:hypothetical protein